MILVNFLASSQTVAPREVPPAQLALYFVFFISFLCLTGCALSLRYLVDEAKLRAEKNISKIVASVLPPERVLSNLGMKVAFGAKLFLFSAIISFLAAVILAYRQT